MSFDNPNDRDAAWHDAANAFQRLLLATSDPAIADSLSPAFRSLRTQAVAMFERAQDRHRRSLETQGRQLFPCAVVDGLQVMEVP
jgi:hypothetical protein